MLQSLHIENIAVIRNADIDFQPGFTVLTGETGAGKSIVVDSIGLLLGARPQRELIRSGAENAVVSAIFCDINAENTAALAELGVEPDEDGIIFLQRVISSDGRAQTKLNGRTIPVSIQREAGRLLINIHGQHENQMLLDQTKHMIYLDRFADDGGEIKDYKTAYEKMASLRRELNGLERDEREKQRMIDMLNFQIADIDSAKLKEGEDDALEIQRKKIKNIERLEKQVRIVYGALYRGERGASVCTGLDRAAAALRQLTDIMPEAEELADKLDSFRYDAEDIAERVNNLTDDDIGDPTAALDKIETRLELITRLKRKYGATVEEILQTRQKCADELDEIENSDERAVELKKELDAAEKAAKTAARSLSETRKEAAKRLSARIMEELAYLDMDKTRFDVEVREAEMTSDGADEVEFMISANPGEPLKPLGKIASGGELSRVMLAIKSVLAGRENTETMIFDEIDTGVSGKTSHKIGVKLRQSASCGQVLCVTHSAQIAALAQNHLLIVKSVADGHAETTVVPLDREGHIREVARIMGGESVTETVMNTAREMVGYADKLDRAE